MAHFVHNAFDQEITMNAQRSFLRTSFAPASLAAAIGLALALGTPAQAQYTYPGTASSAGHSARITPVRAGIPVRNANPPASMSGPGSSCDTPGPDCDSTDGESGGGGPDSSGRIGYGGDTSDHANSIHPIRAGTPTTANSANGYGRGNPSMRRGEACPPGSMCATPVPANGSGGSSDSTAGYGAHESYGYDASSTPARQGASAGGKASISPVRAGAGYGALNYGPSQTSNANFRNSVTGKSSGPNMNPTGQQTSFTGPNGKQVNMSGTQTFTGPNGQRQTIGGGPDLNHLGGGYGHQKGSGMNMGGNVSFSNGSGSMQQTGSAPGMASANGLNMNNGGAAGAEDGADGGNSKLKNFDDGKQQPGLLDQAADAAKAVVKKAGDAWDNLTSSGPPPATDMKPGETRPVGPPKRGGGGNKDSADMGPTAGPGEIVSGTGQIVQPGKHTGQDDGGGQTGEAGTSNGGGRNAQGQYMAPSGQDVTRGPKPKEQGVLKMDYNGKNGAIDPKLSGGNGGGG